MAGDIGARCSMPRPARSGSKSSTSRGTDFRISSRCSRKVTSASSCSSTTGQAISPERARCWPASEKSPVPSYFTMRDFNGDGKPDILYVNGDNFDYSRVLKPYHGIRILENDGHNDFTERYFFPIYGAAQAVVADFDKDGDLDIVTTSNFADSARHPERCIMYFENAGGYQFKPYAFTIARDNRWNVMTTADLNREDRKSVV